MANCLPKLYFAIGFVLLHFSCTSATFRCDVPDKNVTGRSFIPGEKWPNGVVKYEFHSSLTSADRVESQKAIDDIQSKTCIRFQPRSPGEVSYVSIERDDTLCGVARGCRTGGYQYAKFGQHCASMNTMVHELGHSLCLSHEHTRRDRDDYLQFNGCNPSEIPGKDNFDTRGHFYDYTSVMSYQCDVCFGGFPRISGIHCGPDKRPGLSVLDADKLNDFYDCQGCLAHRWKPIEALTDQDIRNLVLAGRLRNGIPLYVCRGYVGSEISVGKFRADIRACWLPSNGIEVGVEHKVQVLTAPSGIESYKVVPVSSLGALKPMPAGRKANGMESYAAIAEINGEVCVGKVFSEDMRTAYIPYGAKEHVVTSFNVLAC